MDQKVLAVCDKEEKYLYRLVECLENRELLPFSICAFTNERALRKFSSKTKIELLLIAESLYEEDLKGLPIEHILILNESGNEAGDGIKNINKYQSAEGIFREIMESCMENVQAASTRRLSGNPMKIIGNYTPIRRCLQTTFSLTMGQILAKKHKVLYMNFENYSGLSYLLNREFNVDISDVLYYFNCEREKLAYRLAGMVQSINGMDFIPPVVSYQDLSGVTGEQWLHLFQEVEAASSYEYLILDLSEQMHGLFNILRQCFKVYTITREDGFAAAKMKQYEAMLSMTEYMDVAAKTKKWNLPVFHRLPDGLEQLTHGELACFVKKIVEEDIYEQTG
ncbi:hypothetical protein [Kineothrix sedimenti]|uniref:TadZ-like receiver domain-containing protein n=1 Tax=Kineothrix sedimenti TaxID=3123317 RepID=A0ABZ3EXG9_9FIRM